MTTLQELLQRREELERRIAETQSEERNAAIATIRQLMSEHGLTVEDVTATRRAAKAAQGEGGERAKVPAKYRNPATGESWSGRGLQPRWLKAALAEGKQLSDFAISEATA